MIRFTRNRWIAALSFVALALGLEASEEQAKCLSSFSASKMAEEKADTSLQLANLERIEFPFHARLKRKDGVQLLPAHNYYFYHPHDQQQGIRQELRGLVENYLNRSPEYQLSFNELLTEGHALNGNSFKKSDPQTGQKVLFTPAIHGNIVPMPRKQFEGLVDSTAPIMNILRKILQGFYGNELPSAVDLGIGALPVERQQEILRLLNESIYFEPKLKNPIFRNYPFLLIARFDAAVSDYGKGDPIFYEYNSGTPSGLSNQSQIIELLSNVDRDTFLSIRDRLLPDETFSILRLAIEDSALHWTGIENGISVVVGPGQYNAAHPDISYIAQYMGLPLVGLSDLYQDQHGYIRLNQGQGAFHPIVSGIYNRMEESYLLQSNENEIPFRSPYFNNNHKYAAEFGVKLEPYIGYDYQYGQDGSVVGISLDEFGQAKLQSLVEPLGKDPMRPNSQGSIYSALIQKKIYVSNLGGRVVDDKRLFEIISLQARGIDVNSARPPRTLSIDDYPRFYESQHLENFVVKEPNKSGGDGVYLLVHLDQQERSALLKEVKARPHQFIIQEFADLAVLTTPEVADQGRPIYGSRVVDWGIFVIQDPRGRVFAGPNSLLLRVAQEGHSSTNTSQGGEYGIGVVFDDKAQQGAWKKTQAQAVSYLGFHQKQELTKLNQLFLHMRTQLSYQAYFNTSFTDAFIQAFRNSMSLLSNELAPFLYYSEQYQAGSITVEEFKEHFLDLFPRLTERNNYLNEEAFEIVSQNLGVVAP